MASGSNFTGFSDSLADTVTADWYVVSILSIFIINIVLRVQGLHLPRGPGFLAFENGVPPYNTFGGSETIPFPTYGPSRTSYLEIPPRTPYTLGVTQDTIRPLQPPYDAHNAVRNRVLFHSNSGIESAWLHSCLQPPITKRLGQSYGLPASLNHQLAHFISSHRSVLPNESPFKIFSFQVPTQPPTPSPLVPTSWVKLPQINYDRGGRQWNYRSSEPTSFSVNGRPGVNMRDALRKEFTGFDGRDDPVLQGAASAISCRLLVGLLWPSIRPLELTPSQVPWVSCQQQFVPGVSTEPIALPNIYHIMKDPRTGLDQEPPPDNAQQARPRDCQKSRTIPRSYICAFMSCWGQLRGRSQSSRRSILLMDPSMTAGGLGEASCTSRTCFSSVSYLCPGVPFNPRSGSRTPLCHVRSVGGNERCILFISSRVSLVSCYHLWWLNRLFNRQHWIPPNPHSV